MRKGEMMEHKQDTGQEISFLLFVIVTLLISVVGVIMSTFFGEENALINTITVSYMPLILEGLNDKRNFPIKIKMFFYFGFILIISTTEVIDMLPEIMYDFSYQSSAFISINMVAAILIFLLAKIVLSSTMKLIS